VLAARDTRLLGWVLGAATSSNVLGLALRIGSQHTSSTADVPSAPILFRLTLYLRCVRILDPSYHILAKLRPTPAQ
jgi:hypothetical protein